MLTLGISLKTPKFFIIYKLNLNGQSDLRTIDSLAYRLYICLSTIYMLMLIDT